LEEEIGSIEVGKKADLVLVSLRKPHLVPPFNPVSNLVYAAQGSDVDTVIIDGRIIMEKQSVLTLDESEIIQEANERGTSLLRRTGLQVKPKWEMV
jgi:5-methylthioadenosine/S-adenosylhomocysteine deaminase